MNNVDYIFHSSSKTGTFIEFFPMEAVKTNIIGADNVIRAGMKFGVKKVICLQPTKQCIL